ncbi:hypothetical protein [Arthrobacter sp. UM1]|uniref:hypothetical protein n=1 Tax=Arthrobacter sp. UM1 TaxID=2766776 RepID=UPI001CF65116|nr:hypothetical protein [Arthrobacter sp. UM1]MCB4209042.1 hypothetical protein [Arthrobacter sp. UM1]
MPAETGRTPDAGGQPEIPLGFSQYVWRGPRLVARVLVAVAVFALIFLDGAPSSLAYGVVLGWVVAETLVAPRRYRQYRERWSREHGGAHPWTKPKGDTQYYLSTGWRRWLTVVVALVSVTLLYLGSLEIGLSWLSLLGILAALAWEAFGAVFVHDGGPGTSASHPEDPPRHQSA